MENFMRHPETACEKLIRQLRAHEHNLENAENQLMGLRMDTCEYMNVYLSKEAIEDGINLPCLRVDLIKHLHAKIAILRASIYGEQIIIEELNREANKYINEQK